MFAVPGEITSSLSRRNERAAQARRRAADERRRRPRLVRNRARARAQGESSPLLDLLPASADELVRKTGLGAGEVARALVELELEGRVVVCEGMYRRA